MTLSPPCWRPHPRATRHRRGCWPIVVRCVATAWATPDRSRSPHRRLRTGYLQRGNTTAELAKQCAIDANALAETVERFNHFASAGEDVDFHRGASAYNRAQGDHQVTLGPLREGPFYAVRILPGSLGTFSGLQTDEHARVLDEQQQPIPGLYAIGNDMSSVMRGYYPSGGITLGPAMTFGYLVGKTWQKKQI
nr:3-oxosteroid 1-dehydrogenase [Klebsiella pneumoniae]